MRKHRAKAPARSGALAFLSLMGRAGADMSVLGSGDPLSVEIRFERFRWAVQRLADGVATNHDMKTVANEVAVCVTYAEQDVFGASQWLEDCHEANSVVRRLMDSLVAKQGLHLSPSEHVHLARMLVLRQALIEHPDHTQAMEAAIDEQLRTEASVGSCVIYA
jgi:hypothetical protein